MPLNLSSGALTIRVDEHSGRLLGVHNDQCGLPLVASGSSEAPFRVQYFDGSWQEGFRSFTSRPLGDGLELRWETDYQVAITARLFPVGDQVEFAVEVFNYGQQTILRVEYPVIAGVGRLGGAGQDRLLHSHATGVLFHDPLDLLDDDPENLRCLRYSPYPDGFHGSTLQMMAYYAEQRGGFLVHTPDVDRAAKWFSVRKEDGGLRLSVIHEAARAVGLGGYAPRYPVVLTALTEGSWHEAADRYATWARRQQWARPRQPRASWLQQEVGIATFGVNASHNRAAWLDRFHQIADRPVFHVIGTNWPQYGQDYHNNHPRGRTDWFPARFNADNLATIRRNGDYWAPFEFDLFSDDNADPGEPVAANRHVYHRPRLSNDRVERPFMCAGTAYWRDMHRWRDEKLVRDYGCDALYYDISVSNLKLRCEATDHDHVPGGGQDLVAAYRSMYFDTLAAAAEAKAGPVPAGTEVINELTMDLFDYYQARAQSTPIGPFELDYFRDWVVAGSAEHVPLFTKVYAGVGPLRLDGWSSLAREAGDLSYWVAARVLLYGGLLELNYEFSGLEDLDDRSDDPDEHYWKFVRRGFGIDPDKARFVRQVAAARTGPANRFLTTGQLLEPPTVESPPVELDFRRYTVPERDAGEQTESMWVPSVQVAAWGDGAESVCLLVNLLPDEQTVRVNGTAVRLPGRQIVIRRS